MSRTVRSVLLERISIPTLKTQREKGETITLKSNNTPCKYPQSNLKIQIMQGSMHNSFDKKEGGKGTQQQAGERVYDWRKTITVNR